MGQNRMPVRVALADRGGRRASPRTRWRAAYRTTAHHLVPAMWRGRDEDEARHSSCCLPSHSVEGFVGFYVG